jgi:hypothetical protein
LYKFHFPEYYQILFNLVSGLSRQVIRLENTPSSIEVNLRKKDNSIFLYLINFTSEMKRPIERIIPVTNIRINVAIKEKVGSIQALVMGNNIEFTGKENSISLVLPIVKDYEVLKINLS